MYTNTKLKIVIQGPIMSGKTTMLKEISSYLSKIGMNVKSFDMGKPINSCHPLENLKKRDIKIETLLID